MSDALLTVEDLRVDVGREAPVHAVRGVSLEVRQGERLGIVGESGSGKSMTAAAVLRLLPPSGRFVSGAIRLGDRDLLSLDENEMHQVRGGEVGMVFQNAKAALNPLFAVGEQIADVYRVHRRAEPEDAWREAVRMLDAMGVPDAESTAEAYPHQYSGGMAQRAMIAMALICSPRLLIADEPTTALDVTIEAQVLDLIDALSRDEGTALILISHDLGVIMDRCESVVVMYAGEVLESGPVERVLRRPANPYTRLLLECYELEAGGRPQYIGGHVPDLGVEPTGCSFADRCPLAQEICRAERPRLRELDGRLVACHRAEEVLDG
jgi:oligopeptide/dipeptide ABC transporter ATP-binding protein